MSDIYRIVVAPSLYDAEDEEVLDHIPAGTTIYSVTPGGISKKGIFGILQTDKGEMKVLIKEDEGK